MKLIKYDPANQIETLFDHLARDVWPTFGRQLEREAVGESLRVPRTNIHESEGSYIFTMEMPGLGKKDVEVTVEDDTLTVRGAKTEKDSSGDTKDVIRCEIRSTAFERSFSLAGTVDADGIKAKVEDGILTVTLPKKPEKVGRKIDIS